ncbi:glycerophosphodiester phosphodiesterase family protein [Bacillus sp. JCM 19041]|uniref:glycerophosphodiester phosphodiesterase family protein n=1 Tax=Bacillus sp. JCM 19041 TaxID=1460637 RepID=UPI0006CF9F68
MINAIAHRGYAAKYPENTYTAFAAAIELRFAVIELDVHLSLDGIPVVIHDFNVDRVTDGKGDVDQFTVAELKN